MMNDISSHKRRNLGKLLANVRKISLAVVSDLNGINFGTKGNLIAYDDKVESKHNHYSFIKPFFPTRTLTLTRKLISSNGKRNEKKKQTKNGVLFISYFSTTI